MQETDSNIQVLKESEQRLVSEVVEQISPQLDGALRVIVGEQLKATRADTASQLAELKTQWIEMAESIATLSSELALVKLHTREYSFDVRAPNLRTRKESLMDSTAKFNRGHIRPFDVWCSGGSNRHSKSSNCQT